MVPKSKKTEAEKNPFLPPPVDLDRIHLADKDHLITETTSTTQHKLLSAFDTEKGRMHMAFLQA
jgi:hypothetical protein